MDIQNMNLFISYRHKDSTDYAKKILSKLKLHEPSCNIFLDKLRIIGGFQYLAQIKKELSSCEVLILLISRYWHTPEGKQRLHDPDDILLRELQFAEKHQILVLPILLEDTQMPGKEDLPENLSWLCDNQGIPVSMNSINSDFNEILRSLALLFKQKKSIADNFDDRMVRLNKLFNEDMDQYALELQKEVDLMKKRNMIPLSVEVKSVAREGINKSDILFPGEWKSFAIKQFTKLTFEFTIEDSEYFNFKGKITVADLQNKKLRKTKIKGTWGKALDTKKNLFMGFFLRYVSDENKHEDIIIPFHSIVGDSYIGTDSSGVQYISRNVKPRPFGM